MTSAKVTFLALAFILISSPSFAQGYMSIKFGTEAQLVYVQKVNAIVQDLTVRIDVTSRVPHEIQMVSNERILVIE